MREQQPPREQFRDRLRRARGGRVQLVPPKTAAETTPEAEEPDAAVPDLFSFSLKPTFERSIPIPPSPDAGDWPTWAVVDWDALEIAAEVAAETRRNPGSVPPPPKALDEARERMLAAAAKEAVERRVSDLEATFEAARARANSSPIRLSVERAETEDDTAEEADEPRSETVDRASDEIEDSIKWDAPEGTPGSDKPVRAEIVLTGGNSAGLALTPEKMWELVKEAAYAAQEARERAARAEGEASVLRQELDRLRAERNEPPVRRGERRTWFPRRR